ncbi:MAG: hypothetical protein ACO35C_04720 [Pontimonas sp.]|jgi:hypothetical protein
MDSKQWEERLDALRDLPLAERADALGALYDDMKDMLDQPDSE